METERIINQVAANERQSTDERRSESVPVTRRAIAALEIISNFYRGGSVYMHLKSTGVCTAYIVTGWPHWLTPAHSAHRNRLVTSCQMRDLCCRMLAASVRLAEISFLFDAINRSSAGCRPKIGSTFPKYFTLPACDRIVRACIISV